MILGFKDFLFEKEEKKQKITIKNPDVEVENKPEDSIYPEKDKKTGEKTVDKKFISKEAIVNGLAKELYNAQYTALTLQMKIDDIVKKMTEKNPDDPNIAILQASGPIQVANAQLRADTIEQQMLAAAANSPKLTQVATEKAAEAKNLALKAALELFNKKLKDYSNEDKEKNKKENKK